MNTPASLRRGLNPAVSERTDSSACFRGRPPISALNKGPFPVNAPSQIKSCNPCQERLRSSASLPPSNKYPSGSPAPSIISSSLFSDTAFSCIVTPVVHAPFFACDCSFFKTLFCPHAMCISCLLCKFGLQSLLYMFLYTLSDSLESCPSIADFAKGIDRNLTADPFPIKPSFSHSGPFRTNS